jgi:hypothetical protein
VTKKAALAILIITILAVSGWYFYRSSLKTDTTQEESPAYKTYRNAAAGYEINAPSDWHVMESTDSGKFLARTVWQAPLSGTNLGNIAQISVTAIASPAAAEALSTPTEFAIWRNLADGNTASDSGIKKIKNETVGDMPAVRLEESIVTSGSDENSFFSQTTWFIKNGNDYYINIMGNGVLTNTEKKDFEDILKSFRWVAAAE